MTSEEVPKMSEELKVSSLCYYRKTAIEKTQLIFINLNVHDLETIPAPD